MTYEIVFAMVAHQVLGQEVGEEVVPALVELGDVGDQT